MKTIVTIIIIAALLAMFSSANSAFAQGTLTPPGAPAPTMKSLAQIEPRTPIASAPFTINVPGSYYLTTNLTTTVSNAITIAASGVTLDLGGFTISSSAASAANGGTAILLASSLSDITILNGHIRGGVTNNSGFYSGPGFGYGISFSGSGPNNTRVSGVSVTGCLYSGIFLNTAQLTSVESCTVRTVGSQGIYASTIKACLAMDCGGTAIIGVQVSDSRGEGGGFYGLSAQTAQNCYGSTSSSGYGLYAVNTAQNCYGYGSTGTGLSATLALNCYGSSSSDVGLYALTAQNCYGSSGSSYGMFADSSAENCYGTSSSGTGLSASTTLNCSGWTSGGSSFGIDALIAQNCYGYNSGAGTGLYGRRVVIGCYGYAYSGTGLSAPIANSCFGATTAGTAQVITFKYNMP